MGRHRRGDCSFCEDLLLSLRVTWLRLVARVTSQTSRRTVGGLVLIFNMADKGSDGHADAPCSVNREIERQIGEIIVIPESREREFTVESSDFVHRRLDRK